MTTEEAKEKPEEKVKKLTVKERAWAEAFLVTLSKAEAARRAKYKGDAAALAHIGWENYRKPHIQSYLADRLAELTMPAGEVLARLNAQACGDIGDFLKFYDGVNTPFLDLRTAKEKGLLHLVKKLKYNKEGQPEIELYDAQAALVQLGRHHKLFTDNAEMNITLAKRIEFFEVEPLEPDQSEQGDNAE